METSSTVGAEGSPLGHPRLLTASRCNAHGSVTEICTHMTARMSGDVAESWERERQRDA
jgi:hypothetical protein